MIPAEMLSEYRRIIQARFDSVCVMVDNRFRDEYGSSISVLGIPDDRRAEFTEFILNELAPGVEDAGFDFVGIMPYSWADAKGVFPEAGKEESPSLSPKAKVAKNPARQRKRANHLTHA